MEKQALLIEITQKELFALSKKFLIEILEEDIPCIKERLLPDTITQSIDKSGTLLFKAKKRSFAFGDNIKKVINIKLLMPPIIVISLIEERTSRIHNTSRIFDKAEALKSIYVINPGFFTEDNEEIIIRLNLEFT